MSEGFVIMQIGNADLDRICDDVIYPTQSATGLDPRRVDRDNTGDLLKSEIVAFIERADIIVADLTNARPNCYLEVGYAMGLGKKKNLILTAREDHRPSSPNYVRGTARVHFDLEGYDILFWDPVKPNDFQEDLERRIRQRLAVLRPAIATGSPAGAMVPTAGTEWRDENRTKAHAGLVRAGFAGYWEALVVIEPKGEWTQQQLLSCIDVSTVGTFGWPIGVSLPQDEHRPLPTAGGVRAELLFPLSGVSNGRASYDLWAMKRTGDFYILRNYFEDTRSSDPVVYFNTRIVQVTELLLFLARLYSRLGVSDATSVGIWITHGGLEGRTIAAIGGRSPSRSGRRPSVENDIETQLSTTVGGLEVNLTENVQTLLAPVFTLFDFFQVDLLTLTDIVDRFVAGEVS